MPVAGAPSCPPGPPNPQEQDKVKEVVKKVVRGAYQINLKDYSRLTGYAWGAFVGAAGLAYLLTQAIGLNTSAKKEGDAAPASSAQRGPTTS